MTGLHETVAELFGTPAYVYDLAQIRGAHAALTASLPAGAGLYYSVQANPHPRVCAQLARLGCGAEVSSAGEIDACLAAGFSPDRCLLTGPAKAPDEIRLAIDRGIREFSAESPVDLRRIAAAAQAAGTPVRCLLRINPDRAVAGVKLPTTGMASQFGADAEWVRMHPEEFAAGPWAEVTGLHLYLESNIADEDLLLAQFEAALETVAGVEAALPRGLRVLNLGGGFAAAYAMPAQPQRYPSLRRRLTTLLELRLPGRHPGSPGGMRLAFESGRYLTAGCGTLVARVMDVKRSKGSTFVVLDSAVNYPGWMSLPRQDGWARGTAGRAVCVGSLVAVPNVGAYGLTASRLGFVSRVPPVEVVVDGAEICGADRLTFSRQPVRPRRDLYLTADATDPAGSYARRWSLSIPGLQREDGGQQRRGCPQGEDAESAPWRNRQVAHAGGVLDVQPGGRGVALQPVLPYRVAAKEGGEDRAEVEQAEYSADRGRRVPHDRGDAEAEQADQGQVEHRPGRRPQRSAVRRRQRHETVGDREAVPR
jgi:diaminopimelate decarboxylase